MRYAWIQNHCDSYDVNTLCDVLGVSRGGYYRWVGTEPSEKQLRTERIAAEAKRVFYENHGANGYRPVHEQLVDEGVDCCKETVRKVLTAQGLHASTPPKFVPTTTDSDHDLPVAENVSDRNFKASRPDEKWCSDITHIHTDEGWMYLAVILDLYSRKIVGWAISHHIRADLVLEALDMAIRHRRPTGDLIFHSDRGSQYASHVFRDRLRFLNITQSMSRKGNCYDNAPAESFFGKLKTEWVRRRRYQTRADARRSIYFYIEMYYNSKRRHASLGYLCPNDFETRHLALAA